MDRIYMTDIASVVTERIGSAFNSLTAGGTGDATSVVGVTIDRSTLSMPQCAEINVYYEAVLSSTNTLSITALKVEHSTDGATWSDYAVQTAPGVVATGAGTVRGAVAAGVNLSSAYRYIRVTHTPDLSAANTDTAKTLAAAVFAGMPELPAAS